MDRNTFIREILPQSPVYAKFDVYEKMNGEWVQVDKSILKTNLKGKIYATNKLLKHSFSNGDICIIELDEPKISFDYSAGIITIRIEKIKTRNYPPVKISMETIKQHTFHTIPELGIKVDDLHLSIEHPDKLEIFFNHNYSKTILDKIPANAIGVVQ